jgi:hypothetical protein
MSSEIACTPPWKLALMERKRRQEKDGQPAGGRSETHLVDMNGLPAWKRDILAKKQQQKNTLVFMARSPGRTIKDTDNDATECVAEHCDAFACIVNGHAASTDHNKRRSCPPNIVPEMTESECCNNNCDLIGFNDEEVDDRPVEERLLPIHRNPILRLDIEKRHSSSQSARSSSSPRTGGESVSSHDRTSVIDETNHVTSPGVFLSSDTDQDVFSAEATNDEVTYGRGFVHKLLMKFSHLAASDQCVAACTPPRLSLGSTAGTRLSVGSAGYGLSGLSMMPSAEAESLQRRRPNASRTKCRSVDDLLGEPELQLVKTDQDTDLDTRRNGSVSSVSGHEESDHTVRPCSLVRKNSVAETEDLPITNIVSNTRSLFENLVTSPRQSNCVPNSSSHNRFSYPSTSEKAKNRPPETIQSAAASKDLEQVPTLQNGLTKCASFGISRERSSDDKKTDTSYAAVNSGISSNAKKSTSVHLTDVKGIQKSDDVSKDNGTVVFDHIRASKDVTAESVKVSAANGHGSDGSSNTSNITAAQDKLPLQKVGDKGDVTAISQTVSCGKPAITANHDVNDKVPTLSEVSSSVSSVPVIPAAVVSSSTATAPSKFSGQKTSASSGISDTRHPVNQGKASSTPGTVSTTVPKAVPSRPGMLLIRPASNLVAANTKTEYLALTKYNDVRKGEFAPASKKVTEPCVDDDVNDVDCDFTDAAPDDDANEQFTFTGAGVHLSRSLLDRTKQGKRVNDLC